MDINISEAHLLLATSKFTDQETARQIVSSVKGIVAAEVKAANYALATKEDLNKINTDLIEDLSQVEVRLSSKIYIVGLVQFIAIVGTLISVITFMLQSS